MKYDVRFVGKHSFHIDEVDFEDEPRIGMELKDKHYPDDIWIIKETGCVPFGVPNFTAYKVEYPQELWYQRNFFRNWGAEVSILLRQCSSDITADMMKLDHDGYVVMLLRDVVEGVGLDYLTVDEIFMDNTD
jgi:hypothetical protein